jgi:hypothetical protein
MPDIDLNPFGYAHTVTIDGTMISQMIQPGLVFLFAESHSNKNAICENLKNACRLIDSGVVDMVAVEERFSGSVLQAVTAIVNAYGSATLKDYSDGLFTQFHDDDSIIAAAKAAVGQMSFARNLLYLRPDIFVASIEDPHLADVAQDQNQQIASQPPPQGLTHAQINEWRLARFRFLEVNRQRELAFIYRMYEAYAKNGCEEAAIMNLGGYHHRHVSRLFDMMGQRYIWVIPPSYVDALP